MSDVTLMYLEDSNGYNENVVYTAGVRGLVPAFKIELGRAMLPLPG